MERYLKLRQKLLTEHTFMLWCVRFLLTLSFIILLPSHPCPFSSPGKVSEFMQEQSHLEL